MQFNRSNISACVECFKLYQYSYCFDIPHLQQLIDETEEGKEG